MAISQYYPSEGPEKILNFANSGKLDSDITFSRASGGTFMGPSGLVTLAGSNVPRFRNRINATSGLLEPLGLLIEESSTNLLLWSESITTSPWATNGTASYSVDSGIAPDGKQTADLVTPSEANFGPLQFINSLPISTSYTFSTFLKDNPSSTVKTVRMFAGNVAFGGTDRMCEINLSNGTISADPLFTRALIYPFPNSWYRVCLTITTTAAGNGAFGVYSSAASGNSYYLWGAQVEQKSFPTSYIPTTSSQASRSADLARVGGSNFSRWYDNTGGILIVSGRQPSASATGYPRWAQLDSADGSANFIGIVRNAVQPSKQQTSVFVSGVGQSIISSSNTVSDESGFYFASGFSANNFRAAMNGVLATPDTSGSLPTPTTLGVGQQGDYTLQVNSCLSQLLYYPGTSYSDVFLQSLTGGDGVKLWNLAGAVPSFHLAPGRTGTATDLITGTVLGGGTVNCASPAWDVGPDGILFQPAANTPVIGYDPVTLRPRGLRAWGAVTNLMLRSEELGNAAWSRAALTVSSDVTTSPKGTQDADKLVESATNAEHITWQSRSAQSETMTLSVFAKASERSRIKIGFSNFTNAACGAFFDLSTGVIIFTDPANADYTSPKASIFAYPAGWYRCVFTVTKGTVNNTNNPFIDVVNNSSQTVYAGDGTSGVFTWGAQLQTGSTLGPYVPTTTTAASSTADVITIAGSDFTRIYNQSAGSVYAEVFAASNTTSGVAFGAADTFDNTMYSAPDFTFYRSGASVSAQLTAPLSATAATKIVTAFSLNDFAAISGNNTISTDTSGAVPVSPVRFTIGCAPWSPGNNMLNGYIPELAVFRSRIANANLQAMTL